MTKCWSCQKNDFGVPTAAAFLKTNSLVVADFGLSCLEFFDSGGHLEHTLTGIKPFGVTSYNDGGSIIVGDRKSKSLRIFDEFGADVSQIDNLGSLEWLSGLAVSRDGNLIMSDRSRCKIIISNIGGEVISEFGSYGSGAKQLCMADFFAVDTKNRIIVCDSGNHCLKIFDSNGNPISTVGSRGNSDGLSVLHYNLKGMSQYDVYNYKYCQM
ncbi:hypothetical protein HELRODRAFT_109866 [Helobdella robusta]|uniref:Uncharacterized protein n=1 Tax=Helobdella robusta TaxID=6412 RepID=T1EEW9_HELRO|nr:hypothetical protein HELRODRAFT_109866 [Helobdella robusta]ESO08816.1 hypothetical protein HELRODRAFT_109866 [Helobdella robusta]